MSWWDREVEVLIFLDPAGREVLAVRFCTYFEPSRQCGISQWVEEMGGNLHLFDGNVASVCGKAGGWIRGSLDVKSSSWNTSEPVKPNDYIVLNEYKEWLVMSFEDLMARYRIKVA